MMSSILQGASRPAASGKEILTAALVIAAIVTTRLHSYLLFHTLVEVSCICVALTAFSLAWNTRRHLQDGFLIVVGMASGPVTLIGLLHALSYKGMGVFPLADANLPTQLWIAMRLGQSALLLAATIPATARQGGTRIVVTAAMVTALLLASVFSGLFPDCYVEGQGLTRFKVAAELVCILVPLIGLYRLSRDRTVRMKRMRQLIIAILLCSALQSATFTLYVDVYGALNMLGHVIALIQALLLYGAVAWVGLALPQESLYAAQAALSAQFEKDALRAQDDILRFTEILAHHLQEPVRQQHVFVQSLAKALPTPMPAEAAQALRFIQDGAIRQRALLRDALRYLSLARPRSETNTCDGNIALERAITEHGAAIIASGAHIERTRLPAMAMSLDDMTELLGVLIDNAIRHGRAGIAPVITITAHRQGADILLSVADNGPGIAPEYRQRIFSVFERLSHDGDSDCTGIGLALARRMVERAGGRIWVDASSDGGACFHMMIPAA